MKILTIVYNLHRGGTERAAQNFSIAYQKAGHNVALLPIYEKGVREKSLIDNGVKVFEPFKKEEFDFLDLIEWGPDIVHIHRAGMCDEVINEILVKIKDSLPKIKIAETNVFSQVDIGAGEKLIDLHMHLSKWCFWKWKTEKPSSVKVGASTVLPYMVIPEKFFKLSETELVDEFKNENNIPMDKFIFGRVAQKSDAKWSLIDIKCFIQLSRVYDDIHLVLLGISPIAVEYIKTLSDDDKLKITVLDYIDGDEKLNILYNSYDVFIHAARIGESFGMVFAESMLTETPVITVATPLQDNSQHEVVPVGAGFVVKNSSAMFEKMEELYRDRNQLEILGKNARSHILDNYTPSVLTDKALGLFNLLLDNNLDNIDEKLKREGYVFSINKNEIVALYKSSCGIDGAKEKIYFFAPELFVKIRSLYATIIGYNR